MRVGPSTLRGLFDEEKLLELSEQKLVCAQRRKGRLGQDCSVDKVLREQQEAHERK